MKVVAEAEFKENAVNDKGDRKKGNTEWDFDGA